MEVLDDGPFEIRLVDSQGRQMGEGRSDGLHWSEVVSALGDMERGKPLEGIKGEQEYVRMMTGFALERVVERAFKEQMQDGRRTEGIQTQWELSVPTDEGPIFMTLDGLDFSQTEPIVEEYKATWRSMGKLGSRSWSSLDRLADSDLALVRDGLYTHFWEWLVRIMGYCRAMETDTARLLAFFVNGDYTYKPGHGPQVRPFMLRFTEQEIEENWTMGLRMATRIRREAGEGLE